jgi:8-oxo-dGTP diphosphatase
MAQPFAHLLPQLLRYGKTIAQLVFRRPIVGVTMIPVLEDGSIVLVRRVDNGCWSLPGGLMDWGETVATTAAREVQEETGLTLVQLGRLVGVYSDPQRDPRIHAVSIVVEAKVAGAFRVEDKLEISDVQAFAPEAIALDQLAHGHGEHLRDYWQGNPRIA